MRTHRIETALALLLLCLAGCLASEDDHDHSHDDAYNITVTDTEDGWVGGIADHYATIESLEGLAAAVAKNSSDMDVAYLVICGALVFFMQAGFAMLEAGIVQPKNATNILFKNLIDASLAAVSFWLLGYGIAYGTDAGGFIGTSNFAIVDINNDSAGWQGWFFQWAFAGAAATIVAGSVCERAKIEAYFIYSIVLTVFIYPVVVHWGWGSGFLSAWGASAGPLFTLDPEKSNGMIDFAGSGVVHMVGGFSGMMGAIVLGPRTGRFVDGQCIELYQGNKILQSLGTFILWFGWYGFNCGSTLMISAGAADVAGKAAVTTTLAAACGAITVTFIMKAMVGHYDISMGLNGALAGLVSITANCSVVDPWMAIIIGTIGGLVLIAGHYLLIKLKIDDPCDATVVHGFAGYWGLLATGMFCTDANVQYAAYPNVNEACASGEQFGVQAVGGLAIIGWTCATAGLTFVAVNACIGLRVDPAVEDAGLDVSEHGSPTDVATSMWAAPAAPPPKTMDAPAPAPAVSTGFAQPMMMAPSYPGFAAPGSYMVGY